MLSDFPFQTVHQALRTLSLLRGPSTLFQVQDDDDLSAWRYISVRQFERDLCAVASYFLKVLTEKGVKVGSVVTLWMPGYKYIDILHILGLSLAGFVPQLCSDIIPNSQLVHALMMKVNSQALIYNGSDKAKLFSQLDSHILALSFASPKCLPGTFAPEGFPGFAKNPNDSLLIVQTSGSSFGTPKPIVYQHSWWHLNAYKFRIMNGSIITRSRGSSARLYAGSNRVHTTGLFMLSGALSLGICQILPARTGMAPEAMIAMIDSLAINAVSFLTPELISLIRAVQKSELDTRILQGLEQIIYFGVHLPEEDDDWCFDRRVHLMNAFGTTEAGLILASKPGRNSAVLHTLPGLPRTFIAVDASEDTGVTSNKQLYELVIPSISPDVPPAYLGDENGDFHTSDLFEKAEGDGYIWRGRTSDWIKDFYARKIDAKSIEDAVSQSCSEAVHACIVVGHLRPSPAILVEPTTEYDDPESWDVLRTDIVARTKPRMDNLLSFERVTNPSLVKVVERGSLPRTAVKGNISRYVAENKYKQVLDAIYDSVEC